MPNLKSNKTSETPVYDKEPWFTFIWNLNIEFLRSSAFPCSLPGRIKTNKGDFFNQARHSNLHVFDIWMQICFGKRLLSPNNAVFSHNS